MKSTMTLNRSLWRTAQQVRPTLAYEARQAAVEYRKAFVYCYPKVGLR